MFMTFDDMGLAPRLLLALRDQGLASPTPIQAGAIPTALAGRDVLGLAETGSGKTLAFGLPMLHAFLADGRKPRPRMPRGLVLAPTRELARQIHDALAALARGTALRLGLVTGGAGFAPQVERLARGVSILVATPGRLLDLADRRAVDLSATEVLVLDEADQMLDLGFIHALRRLAALLPRDRRTMLFSATLPRAMEEIAASYLREPVRVEANPPGRAVARIAQSVHFLPRSAKLDLLLGLLDGHRDERALVFVGMKHAADRLLRQVEAAGFAAAALHGNKSQGQRDRAVAAFRAGDLRVLVATDVAARGLDIAGVGHVYNFDLPKLPEAYVHRIGRTARAGAEGRAVAFCTPEEAGELRAIEKAMGETIPVASGERPAAPAAGRRPGPGAGAKAAPRSRRGRPAQKDRRARAA
jgi:ATP-dependent RNA helicase RhlE